MDIYIDIETLRSPESHKAQILEEVKTNFKAPSNLTKTQAAKDLGMTDAKEIKFTSAGEMTEKWEAKFAEIKAPEVALAKWEKTSFDPNVSPIACICIGHYEKDIYKKLSFSLTEYGDEQGLLMDFHEYINAIGSAHGEMIRKPNFIGHYITKFDLPFIYKRSVINDVSCAKGVKWIDAKHGFNCYDTMTAWAGYGNSISADNLADILGLQRKTEGMDGSKVYDTWQEDPQKVISYCHDDVEMVKQIHNRLTK